MCRRVGKAFPHEISVAAFVAVAVSTRGEAVAEGSRVEAGSREAVAETGTVSTVGVVTTARVAVGGGREGSGVMTLPAERVQADNARASRKTIPI
jgi:hypothetical protein